MQIYISRITGKVVPSQSPLTFTINVPDDFSLVKSITVQNGEIQKTNKNGELLYHQHKEVATESENYFQETVEETTESRLVTKTIEKEVTNKWIDENGEEHSQVVKVQDPVEWVDNTPIMIPNMVSKSISFSENPYEFTVEEILSEKYKNLLNDSQCESILVDAFLDENDLDLLDPNHMANTGVGILELLPKGQAKTKSITLDAPSKSFFILDIDMDDGIEVYLSGQKFVERKVNLSNPISNCTIKFVNATEKPKNVRLYAIGY